MAWNAISVASPPQWIWRLKEVKALSWPNLLLKPEEPRTFYLMMMLVACLVGTYAFWIPEGVPFYLLGAGLGLTCAWQAPAILAALCAIYGISLVKVYPMPRWRPEIRHPAWPESIADSSSVVL